MKFLVIGDIHFKIEDVSLSNEIAREILKIAKTCEKIDGIVLLGDILDTHNVADVDMFNIAMDTIDELSKIAFTYVLMGNHDLKNHILFLSDRHFFNPLKKWENVAIVDKPLSVDDGNIIMCPYVPPGRFKEALNGLVKYSIVWEFSDCIFAHQEIEGCKMGSHISEIGDKWDDGYPTVISGHIHDEETVGSNVHYIGSAAQHSFADKGNKYVWIVDVNPEDDSDLDGYTSLSDTIFIKKIRISTTKKVLINLTTQELIQMNESDLQRLKDKSKIGNVKILLKGDSAEFKVLRTSQIYKELEANGIKVSHTIDSKIPTPTVKYDRGIINYRKVFADLVSQKSDDVQDEYKKMFG